MFECIALVNIDSSLLLYFSFSEVSELYLNLLWSRLTCTFLCHLQVCHFSDNSFFWRLTHTQLPHMAGHCGSHQFLPVQFSTKENALSISNLCFLSRFLKNFCPLEHGYLVTPETFLENHINHFSFRFLLVH